MYIRDTVHYIRKGKNYNYMGTIETQPFHPFAGPIFDFCFLIFSGAVSYTIPYSLFSSPSFLIISRESHEIVHIDITSSDRDLDTIRHPSYVIRHPTRPSLISIAPTAARPPQVPPIQDDGRRGLRAPAARAPLVVDGAHLDRPARAVAVVTVTVAVAVAGRVSRPRTVHLLVVGVRVVAAAVAVAAAHRLLVLRLEGLAPARGPAEVRARPDQPQDQQEAEDRPDHDAGDRAARQHDFAVAAAALAHHRRGRRLSG